MRDLRQRLIATYLAFDPRSLGLFRILLGIVLLADLYRRYLGVDYWYTDSGIVPRAALIHADTEYLFSLFLYASTRTQAIVGMLLCAVVYALFTVGFKTRLMHVMSLICVVSLNNRIALLENGGQYVLNLLCVWSLFLPLGRRFSLDARLGRRPRGDRRPVVSLAVLALLLQFAVIYLFNVLHKTGSTWREGSAVHYALYIERLVTTVGVWVREQVPYAILEAASWGTLVLEGLAVVLILSPIATRHLRLVAILLLPVLHLVFNLCLHLGIFSLAMIAFYALLLAPEHWEWMERRWRRRVPATRSPGPPSPGVSTSRTWLRRSGLGLKEVAVIVILAASVGDLAKNSPAWPSAWRYRQPEWLEAIILYPRIRQLWVMFSPGAEHDPVTTISVEAETAGGRVVDPYNEVASRYDRIPPPDGTSGLPTRLGQNQFFSAYSRRFARPGIFERYHGDLRMWIWRYPERTGNPADRIVRFRVYQLSGTSPEPGTTVKYPMKRRLLFEAR